MEFHQILALHAAGTRELRAAYSMGPRSPPQFASNFVGALEVIVRVITSDDCFSVEIETISSDMGVHGTVNSPPVFQKPGIQDV